MVIRRLADALKMLHQQKLPLTVLDDAKQAEEILKKAGEITRPGAYMIPSWAIAKVLREKSAAKLAAVGLLTELGTPFTPSTVEYTRHPRKCRPPNPLTPAPVPA